MENVQNTRVSLNHQNQCFELFRMLYIANVFSYLKIYLIWNSEGRGRIICNNTPLSFYSTKEFRNLFEFYDYSTIDSIDATSSTFQIIGELVLNEKIMKLKNVLYSPEKQDFLIENFGKSEKDNAGMKYIYAIYEKKILDKMLVGKSKIATMPNAVHYTDSLILMHVLTKCREQNIPIITVHDCFYTSNEFLNKIKDFYKEGYIKYIIEDSVLFLF